MLSWTARLDKLSAEQAQRNADPLRAPLEGIVRGMDAVSTHALLDLIGLRNTTGNGRRIAPSMRALGFVPIKSRQLMPGGWRDTASRGWARPVRKPSFKQGDKVGNLHRKTDRTDEQKEVRHVA
jgi:hypothetical protein